MIANVLIDTNVLVYAYDRSEPAKQIRAAELLDALASSGQGVLTTQVLAEFFVVVTSRIAPPLPASVALGRVQRLCESWRVLDITPLVVLEAIRGVQDYQLHYWDAQLWAAAKLNQIRFVFTEDLPSSDSLDGVKYIDPFSSSNGTDWLSILTP